MRIYVNKDNCISAFGYVNSAPITGNINAPLALSIARERMIVKKRIKRIFQKQIPAIFKRLLDFRRTFNKFLFKISMKYYLH